MSPRLPARVVALALAATVVVFAATELLPGDAGDTRDAGRATEEEITARRAELGLDRPAPVRYLLWLGGLLTGDPGRSLITGRPVAELLGERLPATTALVVVALLLATLLTALALLLAHLRGGRGGAVAAGLAAVPQPAWAAVFGGVLAGLLGWVPPVSLIPVGGSAWTSPQALVLPALTLAVPSAGYATGLLHGVLADTLRRPHVIDAERRGLPPLLVLWRHVVPFLWVPALRVGALLAGGITAGTALVETIFGYPGIGGLLVSAVAVRDIPVVQAAALPPILVLLAGVLVADLVAARSGAKADDDVNAVRERLRPPVPDPVGGVR
ncbi:ABC transporter permease [Streptomyces sp. ST2-7A]|uniref:ABC transporter permease n=1 Tax=Streptomyces sp. ST2-7A TaxID=2907214 RepID=UPI001F36A644|nr:ABC transporter permease [Streptomyces sp. ST2-7A]MCE7079600.1 ABC transporter permease [Streptomyces sp. ST2-7A]